jgi:phage terminase large subunit GpA-like protein
MLTGLSPYTIRADYPFLPPALRGLDKPKLVSFSWTKAERKICRKRKDIPTSEWAEQHRVLTAKDSDREGPWKNDVTPYLSGIMDAVFFPTVREMVVVAPPQTGKSEAINNIVGKIIDVDPGPVLYIYPNEKDAKKNIKRRVLGMIKASPRLSQYFTGYKDDESSSLINLAHMMIRAGWSGSTQSLASTPERYVIFEETDKYQDSENDKETSSILLGEKRMRTFRGRNKSIKISSPTTESGPIWQALLSCEVIFEYVSVCPQCGAHQTMDFGDRESTFGVKFPQDVRDPNQIESKDLAWYQCCRCLSQWDNYTRDQAVKRGYWRQNTPDGTGLSLFATLERMRPKRIGFQYPAWISPFVSLSECAASFLRGLQSRTALKDFLNGYAAEPWTQYRKERKEDRILALCDDRPPGLVPGHGRVAGLFAGVDTHGPGAGAGFFFVIRAYGWSKQWTADGGLVAIPQEKWLIRRGFVTSFEALEKVLIEDTYHDLDGNTYPILRVVQDAMGGRTKEVYDFSRKYRGWLHPFKGERNMSQMWKFSPQDQYPGTNKPIPGGVQLLRGNVTMYKNSLSTDLEVSPGDPGCRWLHASAESLVLAGHPNPSLGIDLDFARHLTSEYIDDHGFWECPESSPNHYWDCEVYADIASDVSQVGMWDPPAPSYVASQEEEYQTSQSTYIS